MGVFRVSMLAFQAGGNVPPWNGVANQAALLAVFNTFPAAGGQVNCFGNDNFVLIPDSDGIYLDAAVVPISENALPPGFTITPGTTALVANIIAAIGTCSYRMRIGAATSPLTTDSLAYSTVPALTMNGLLATTVGMDITGIDILNAVSMKYIAIIGQYEIVSYIFTVSAGPYNPGDTVNITTDGSNPDLLNITEIQLAYFDALGEEQELIILPANFLLWTDAHLGFVLPDEDIEGPAVITGTLFGGSVPIATISVLFVNGSGIYRIVTNKTNDTVYLDSSVDDSTVTLKIPNPFIKTGFIGG